MIRLFASDMDGTLLNDKGYISDRTINAVKKLQKHGIHIASLPKSIAKQILTVFERHGAFADIATEYEKTSITNKNTLLSYYKNEVCFLQAFFA